MKDTYNNLDRINYFIWIYANNPISSFLPLSNNVDKDWILSPECDIIFRNLLKSRLIEMGFSEDLVEEGIEIYGYLWKNKYMKMAFNNIYSENVEYKEKSVEEKFDFIHNWLKTRKDKYYLLNKDSVEKYLCDNPESHPTDKDILYAETKLKEINKKGNTLALRRVI